MANQFTREPEPQLREPDRIVMTARCSSAQQRYWQIDARDPGTPALNIAVKWRIRGHLDASLAQEAFQAILKRYEVAFQPVADLWPKLGTSDFTSHVAALQRVKPDLVFCSFWAADASIFLRQAHAAGLLQNTKLVFPVAGIIHWTLKKTFTPEGMLLGYNTWYFEHPQSTPLAKEFVKWYADSFKGYPSYECDHAYFTIAAYKAAAEKAAKAAGGKWPDKEQIIDALAGIEAESLSGPRRYRKDHVMEADFYLGLVTHKNRYDFVTIDPIERMPIDRVQTPVGMGLYEWINTWKV